MFAAASFLGLALFMVGVMRNDSWLHWYLIWNLALAWIPFGLSLGLIALLKNQRWTDWLPLAVTFLWLAFLPNTFYMLTDYVHLHDVKRVDEMFDIAMFSLLIGVGVGLGYASVALIHRELARRLPMQQTWWPIGLVFVLSSFAIYIGRDLRWNTWDVITNPAGILFDLSERIINPTAHPQTYVTTLTYFVVLFGGYLLLWRLMQLIRNPR